MKAENTIKQDFLSLQHSHCYGEDEKSSKAFCFEVVSGCNRHANA